MLLPLLLAFCADASGPGSGGPLAANLDVVAGAGQSGAVLTALANPIVVLVTDSLGAALPDVTVRFLATSGGGSANPDTVLSNANGLAQTTWSLGAVSGDQTLTARVARPGASQLLVTVTATGRVASTLQLVAGGGQSGAKGAPLAAPVRFLVKDSTGTAFSGVLVRFAAANGGSASPDSAYTDGFGQAATTWTLGPAAGIQSLQASIVRPTRTTLTADVQATAQNFTRVALSGAYGLAVNGSGLVYVTQGNAAAAVAVSSVSGRTITGSIGVGSVPTGVTFNPAGTEAYVTNQLSHSVGVINASTNTVAATIPVPNDPFVVAFSTTGAQAFVATNVGMVYRLQTATRTITDSVMTGNGANGLAASPDGTKLYVSAFVAGIVYEVNLSTFTVARTFTTGGTPQGLVISSDGAELYVANEANRVEVWNIAAGTHTTDVAVPGGAFGLAQSPDGTRLYTTLVLSGQVFGINRTTRAVVDSIHVGGDPRRLAFSANGQTLVISNQSGWIDFVP